MRPRIAQITIGGVSVLHLVLQLQCIICQPRPSRRKMLYCNPFGVGFKPSQQPQAITELSYLAKCPRTSGNTAIATGGMINEVGSGTCLVR